MSPHYFFPKKAPKIPTIFTIFTIFDQFRVPPKSFFSQKKDKKGVAVDGGLEAATAAICDYSKRNAGKDRVLLKIDFANAFNSVHRGAFMQPVATHLPGLLPFVQWCYGVESLLIFGDVELSSMCGAQQGDPLGPLLFSLAIKQVTETMKQQEGVDLSVWYLDDGTIGGSPQGVSLAFQTLIRISGEMGLAVKLPKCELIPLSESQTDEFLVAVGFDVSGLKVIRNGFEFLGAPIGNDEFCEGFMQAKVAEFAHNLRLLGKVRDPQLALTLLRHCEGFCRIVFHMRAIGHRCSHGYLTGYDDEVDKVLASILGDPDGHLPPAARLQAALPVNQGGLGVRRARDHWLAAALGSSSAHLGTCLALDPAFNWDADGWRSSASQYNSLVAEDDHVDPSERPCRAIPQRDLSAAIVDVQRRSLMDGADTMDRARLLSLSLPGTGAWVTALPEPANRIAPEAYTAALRLRLGVPLYSASTKCDKCGVKMDAMGVHVLNCPRGGCRIQRHNATRDTLGALCSDAGLAPSLEPLHIVLGNQKPADVFLPMGIGERRGRCLDVSVVNPSSQCYLEGSSKAKGYAASKGQIQKRGKHQDACGTARVAFTPFIMEVHGGLGDEAAVVWKQLCRVASDRRGGNYAKHSMLWGQRLGVSLMREVGKALASRGTLCLDIGGELRQRRPLAAPTPCVPGEYYARDQRVVDPYVAPCTDELLLRLEAEDPAVPDLMDVQRLNDELAARVELEEWMARRDTEHALHAALPLQHPDNLTCPVDTVDTLQSMIADDADTFERDHQLFILQATTPPDFTFTVGDSAFDAFALATAGVLASGELRNRAVRQVTVNRDLAERTRPSLLQWATLKLLQGNADVRSWPDPILLEGLARATGVAILCIIGGQKPTVLLPLCRSRDVVGLAHSGEDHAPFVPIALPEAIRQHVLALPPPPTPPTAFCHSTALMSGKLADRHNIKVGTCESCQRCCSGADTHWECLSCGSWACTVCFPSVPLCPRVQGPLSSYRAHRNSDRAQTLTIPISSTQTQQTGGSFTANTAPAAEPSVAAPAPTPTSTPIPPTGGSSAAHPDPDAVPDLTPPTVAAWYQRYHPINGCTPLTPPAALSAFQAWCNCRPMPEVDRAPSARLLAELQDLLPTAA